MQRHCPHMVVVSCAVLKQDEQRKLFLRNLKCFLKGMHEKEAILLSLGRDRQLFCILQVMFSEQLEKQVI